MGGSRTHKFSSTISTQRPSGEVPGLEASIGYQIDRSGQGHDQSRRERAHIAGAIGRRGGEALAAVRQRPGRVSPRPAAVRGGRA